MEREKCIYDYANKCDCSEDDNCGCSYPNNMGADFDCENQNKAHNSWQTDVKVSSMSMLIAQKDK